MSARKYTVFIDPFPVGLEGLSFTEKEINAASANGVLEVKTVFISRGKYFILGLSGLRQTSNLIGIRDFRVGW